MKAAPKDPSAPAHPFGTTMRIEITPEALEEAKLGKRSTGPMKRGAQGQPILKPRAGATAIGGLDFQQLLQNIYDGVLITELNGQVVQANIRANQFFHAAPGELAGFNVLSLICGAEETLLPTILETLRDNRYVLLQATCLRMDGSCFPVEISVNQLNLGGQPRFSFFLRDVSVRKEQEDRLRTGYTAMQNSSSAIAITGPDAAMEYGNPAFFSIFRLAEDSRLGALNLREFVSEEAKIDEVIATARRGETWEGELNMRRADRTTFFAHASVTANLNADGEQTGLVLSLLDMTPQKLAQQQLEAYARVLHEKNAEMQGDLDVAGELHQAMLPDDFEVFPADTAPERALLRFRHLYAPCGTIGGDFFDIRKVSDHEAAIFISDVMGHGIRSALVVATIRGLIEELRPLAADPGALLTQLNATYTAIFKRMGGDVIFATALYAVIDTRTGRLRFANAGHPLPFVLGHAAKKVSRLASAAGAPRAAIGLFETTRYGTSEHPLHPGDTLLLFTDGLSEAENAAGELYEAKRFPETLKSLLGAPLQEVPERLLEDAREFSSAESFEDDICLLAMELVRTESGVSGP